MDIQALKKLYHDAMKYCDIPVAEEAHRRLKEMEHIMGTNPMEDDVEIYSGVSASLDPITQEYAKTLADRIDQNTMAMQQMWVASMPPNPSALTAGSGAMVGSGFGGSNITFHSTLKPMAVFNEPTQAQKEADKRRHLKLFVHFATEFTKRYPKWTVVPDEADPLHSVHLLMKERGAMIHNLYPSNEMAVYGGPASWVDPRKELGRHLPIVKVNTQEFWGWCVGMDDVPEWMI